MIARQRGDTCAPTRWRPSWPGAAPTSELDREEPLDEPSPQRLERADALSPADAPRRRSRAPIAVATVIAVALIAGQQHIGRAPAKSALPSTPTQWAEQWTTASIKNPVGVCDHLFAPGFKSDAGRTCTSYYNSVKGTRFRIRHVVQDANTATVEGQEVEARHHPGYVTFVISHVGGGWQAVDVVPSGPARFR